MKAEIQRDGIKLWPDNEAEILAIEHIFKIDPRSTNDDIKACIMSMNRLSVSISSEGLIDCREPNVIIKAQGEEKHDRD